MTPIFFEKSITMLIDSPAEFCQKTHFVASFKKRDAHGFSQTVLSSNVIFPSMTETENALVPIRAIGVSKVKSRNVSRLRDLID